MRRNILCWLAVVGASIASGQSIRPINGVTSWTGTVHYTAQGSGSQDNGSSVETWKIGATAHLTVRVDWNDQAGWYEGTVLDGHVSLEDRHEEVSPYSSSLLRTSADEDLVTNWDGTPRHFVIQVNRNQQYALLQIDPLVNARQITQTNSTVTYDAIQAVPWYNGDDAGYVYHSVAPGATELTGSYDSVGRSQYPLTGNVQPNYTWHVEYSFQPTGQSEDDEVVVTSDAYDEFRPQAAPDGGRGNVIAFKAVLQRKGGGAPSQKAVKFEWALPQVSREPGFAMNVPVADAGSGVDLRFEASNDLAITDGDGLAAETPAGLRTESTAAVGSYDWGGWGTLRVVATLEDGKRVQGVFVATGDTDIRLPKRAADSRIAEVWRKAHTAGSDDADDEGDPVGDGNPGDGLTVYEEYRGFLENGAHIEGDTAKKDYFIRQEAGGGYDIGVKVFRNLTGLVVHSRFTAAEFPESRVMNANYSQGPHVVDQHGVRIIADARWSDAAQAVGGPGTPGMIKGVYVPPMTATMSARQRVYQAFALAHELLHSCNVYHHGDHADHSVFWRNDNGVDTEYDYITSGKDIDPASGRPIRILGENQQPWPMPLPPNGVRIVLGSQQGPHAGSDICVMRYDVSNAYQALSDASVRYKVREIFGTLLCHDTPGTGVNDASHQPQSRYGDSDAGRGNCAGQILVNDAVTAPQR